MFFYSETRQGCGEFLNSNIWLRSVFQSSFFFPCIFIERCWMRKQEPCLFVCLFVSGWVVIAWRRKTWENALSGSPTIPSIFILIKTDRRETRRRQNISDWQGNYVTGLSVLTTASPLGRTLRDPHADGGRVLYMPQARHSSHLTGRIS